MGALRHHQLFLRAAEEGVRRNGQQGRPMTEQPVDGLMPFHAMEILKRAKAMEADGRVVCHLELGEPGAPPAPKVIEAVARALPMAQGYTNAKGLTELRDGLTEYYAAQHGMA